MTRDCGGDTEIQRAAMQDRLREAAKAVLLVVDPKGQTLVYYLNATSLEIMGLSRILSTLSEPAVIMRPLRDDNGV